MKENWILNKEDFCDTLATGIDLFFESEEDCKGTVSREGELDADNLKLVIGIGFEDKSQYEVACDIDRLYDEYKCRDSKDSAIDSMMNILENIVKSTIETHRKIRNKPELLKDTIIERVKLKLVNTKKNQSLLSETPHFEVGELSAIPYCSFDDFIGFVVKNGLLESLKITPDEVLEAGQRNIDNEEFCVEPIGKVMRKIAEENKLSDCPAELEVEGAEMVVITNQAMHNGAYGILSKKALNKAAKMLGCKFEANDRHMVIIPSSRHEVLCVADNGNVDGMKMLQELVSSVNEDIVVPDGDYLGDEPMLYDGNKIMLMKDMTYA